MKKVILAGAIIVALVAIGGFNKLKNINFASLLSKNKILTEEEAKTKVSDYINKNLMQPGTIAEVKDIAAEGDLYKVTVNAQGQEITAYMAKDGSKFFPTALDMNKELNNQADSGAAPNAETKDIAKSDKPVVELFTMSYCPYGTQIEKGILPVLDKLGNKIDFSLKFVSYAMHDKKELDENLRQYCIQKNNPEKLDAYLECFLKKGQGTESDCIEKTGIAAAKIASCSEAADKQYKVTESYNDKSAWNGGQFPPFNVDKADNEKYGVQGSPTLVINGTTAQSGRDPASIMKTICSAFSDAPDECNQELSSAVPSPGFGEGTGSSSDAGCGS